MNRLKDESSPYLRQHANNPVDWYPWGAEALQKARDEDKPIFLSIGYSACHWCHVMEHESFENEEIANILNEKFVSIKVDREERPDLDQIYMTSVQMLTGQGGWPMTVFLMPDLRPFFGGTYFPPNAKYGRPGFRELILQLSHLWETDRPRVTEVAGNITQHLQQIGAPEDHEDQSTLDETIIQHAVSQLRQRFDPVHGGFGQPPKFLHTMDMRLLLRAWHRYEDEGDVLHIVRHTLDCMGRGGIYDHLGGGFARYSTDARWLVPHFEKMLYDNALMVVTYLEAFQATGEPFYREIVEETLTWTQREMTSEEGPFFSAMDADSEGVEGKFYVWSQKEIEEILGEETASLFCRVYGVKPEGNWEGSNILHRSRSWSEEAKAQSKDESELRQILSDARQKLFDVRSQRVWPGLDDKVLTSWNGLMIGAFAEAASVLDNPTYAECATKAADFILTRMRDENGRLLRTWSAGSEAKLNAYLEDYAFLADGLISLYEATFDPRWIQAAEEICAVMIEQFRDEVHGGFYFTGRDHEELITRNRDFYDNAIPSGNAMAATALVRLSRLTGDRSNQGIIDATFEAARGLLTKHPIAASQLLIALDFEIGPSHEIALVGEGEELSKALKLLRSSFLPRKVIASGDDSVGLLKGKTSEGSLTTYLCQNGTCQAPLIGLEALSEALKQAQD